MTILDGIKFLPSPNHASRNGTKITDIVLHWMDGTLAAADATFANAAHQTSAHYGIEGAVIHRYVADSETAWHCGDKPENQRSIGIEHSADPKRPATPATIATSVSLIVALCRKYNISPDHIYPHKKFYPTQCPGTLPIADIIARVHAQLGYPTNPPPTSQTQEQTMADLTLTNPLTHAPTTAATGLNSTWFYAVAIYGIVKDLAAKAGVVVDEKALAADLIAGLSAPLKAAVAAAVTVGGSPDAIADAVVARLATALTGA